MPCLAQNKEEFRKHGLNEGRTHRIHRQTVKAVSFQEATAMASLNNTRSPLMSLVTWPPTLTGGVDLSIFLIQAFPLHTCLLQVWVSWPLNEALNNKKTLKVWVLECCGIEKHNWGVFVPNRELLKQDYAFYLHARYGKNSIRISSRNEWIGTISNWNNWNSGPTCPSCRRHSKSFYLVKLKNNVSNSGEIWEQRNPARTLLMMQTKGSFSRLTHGSSVGPKHRIS